MAILNSLSLPLPSAQEPSLLASFRPSLQCKSSSASMELSSYSQFAKWELAEAVEPLRVPGSWGGGDKHLEELKEGENLNQK